MAYRPRAIKSVQQTTVTINNGATSGTSAALGTTVVPANTVLSLNGMNGADGSGSIILHGMLDLNGGGTAVTASCTIAPNHNITLSVTVTEYYGGVIKNVQRGQINIATLTTQSAAITRDTNFGYHLDWLGQDQLNSGGFSDDKGAAKLTISGNNVVATRNTADANGSYGKVAYQYWEA